MKYLKPCQALRTELFSSTGSVRPSCVTAFIPLQPQSEYLDLNKSIIFLHSDEFIVPCSLSSQFEGLILGKLQLMYEEKLILVFRNVK